MSGLRFYFVFVLAAMLAATIWASSQVALWKMPREVATHPWFIATLIDTYFAFLVFDRVFPVRCRIFAVVSFLGTT